MKHNKYKCGILLNKSIIDSPKCVDETFETYILNTPLIFLVPKGICFFGIYIELRQREYNFLKAITKKSKEGIDVKSLYAIVSTSKSKRISQKDASNYCIKVASEIKTTITKAIKNSEHGKHKKDFENILINDLKKDKSPKNTYKTSDDFKIKFNTIVPINDIGIMVELSNENETRIFSYNGTILDEVHPYVVFNLKNELNELIYTEIRENNHKRPCKFYCSLYKLIEDNLFSLWS